jgi:transposase-like protein
MNALDPELKRQVVEVLSTGVPVKDIARQFNLPRSTVYNWRQEQATGTTYFHNRAQKKRALEMRAALYPVSLISRQLNVPQRTLYQWFSDKGETMPNQHDQQLKRRVYELRAEGWSVRAIAKEVRLPHATVYNWLTQARNRAKSLLEKVQGELAALADTTPMEQPQYTNTLLRLARHLTAALRGMSM